ncbi:hypothetical protein, partial [Endozoicomonas sp. ONNA2]|uniref:hypothetical protein n=1 Tax=Endozoicomonas sp. ONNA2 TaxID=2828741 RepID=UPI00214863E2
MAKQPNLGKLMGKAIAVLNKHRDENFASFDQASTHQEIASLKQQVSDIDQQIGEEATGINDLARLENRQCLLTINVRARVEDGSVIATHIDGGPIAQQQTMGSPLPGPVHTATTDQPSQTDPEMAPDDRPMAELTAQDLTDSSPADQNISINSPNTGAYAAPLTELEIEVIIENPFVGRIGQDDSLIPGIIQGLCEPTDSLPGISSPPDGTGQTGDAAEDYSELDGVEGLFAEPDNADERTVTDPAESDVNISQDEAPIDNNETAIADDQSVESTRDISVDESSSKVDVTDGGIDNSEPSETPQQPSDDSGGSQDSNPTGTAFTADGPGLDDSVDSDSGYLSGDEGDPVQTP